MTKDTTTQRLMFEDLHPKPIVMEFDQERGSSDMDHSSLQRTILAVLRKPGFRLAPE